MPNSNSPHSRRLRADNARRWESAQKAAGHVKLAVLLPPESAAQLARLAKVHGTKTAAIIAALAQSSALTP